jgi:Na+/H+-dicarboxylate symporter
VQIYTKIFIGMALGVLAGLALGPQSSWLAQDMIAVPDPGTLPLLAGPGAGKHPILPLPKMVGTSYRLRMSVFGERKVDGRRYYHVGFEVDSRLALKDRSSRLRPQMTVRGWVAANKVSPPVSLLGDTIIGFISPVGSLFLRLIMMVVVPLVFSSLLCGVASLGDPRQLGRLGGKTLGYFLLTTAVAIGLGLAVVNVVQPGKAISAEAKAKLVADYGTAARSKTEKAADRPSSVENLLRMVPKNPVKALARGEMLQIIFFAAVLGFALTLLRRETAQQVIAVFQAINDAMIKVVEWVMKLAPYGVFALVAQVVGQSGVGVLSALASYAGCVVFGLALHAVLVYTVVVRVVGKVGPLSFWRAIRPAQLIAFSTSSSSATLPVTMECAEKKLGISNRVASFVLPLGSTVNMDGTALYQGVAAVFIAQVFDIQLSLADQLSIVLTATLASIGAAGVPGVGMVTLALVLTAIQVPTVGVALILGVDRILDMFRTALNVTGDMSAAVLVASSEGERLTVGGGLPEPAEQPEQAEQAVELAAQIEAMEEAEEAPTHVTPATDQGDED